MRKPTGRNRSKPPPQPAATGRKPQNPAHSGQDRPHWPRRACTPPHSLMPDPRYPTPNSPMEQPCPANTTAATPEREMTPHLAGRRPDSPLAEYRRTDATLPGRRPANPESGEHRQPSREQQQPEPDQPQRQIKYQPEPRTTPEPVTIEPTHHQASEGPASSEQRARSTVHACTTSAVPDHQYRSLIEQTSVRISNDCRVCCEERFAASPHD